MSLWWNYGIGLISYSFNFLNKYVVALLPLHVRSHICVSYTYLCHLQYDSYGWTPKEYNPDEKQSTEGQDQGGGVVSVQNSSSAPQSGFVWDEASGYYYDAASGFYYDGNTGFTFLSFSYSVS